MKSLPSRGGRELNRDEESEKTNMKIIVHVTAALLFSQVLISGGLQAEEKKVSTEPEALSTIAGAIETYRNKGVTMTLRLKIYDTVFDKIVFYDENNHDIEFPVEVKKIPKSLKRQLINLHNGMLYRVTFTVRSVGALGLVTGDLVSFTPLVMERLP